MGGGMKVGCKKNQKRGGIGEQPLFRLVGRSAQSVVAGGEERSCGRGVGGLKSSTRHLCIVIGELFLGPWRIPVELLRPPGRVRRYVHLGNI